jgi:hypothetical protein
MSRWDKPENSRTMIYSRWLLIGAAITFVAMALQLLVFVSSKNMGLAATNGIAEGTLGVMLIWASFFMRKVGEIGSRDN